MTSSQVFSVLVDVLLFPFREPPGSRYSSYSSRQTRHPGTTSTNLESRFAESLRVGSSSNQTGEAVGD